MIKLLKISQLAITKFIKDRVFEVLGSQPFSLIVDETTDCPNKKQLGLVVRYLNEDFEYEYELLDLMHVEKGDAETLFNKLKGCLFHENLVKNLVRLATDGANTMRGRNYSLSQKIKILRPNIYSVYCLCHIGNLVAKKAQMAIPKCIYTFLSKINSYFSQSSSRHEEF